MATKIRIVARCSNPNVPNEVWDLFKKELRKFFKLAFPDQKYTITEFYWQSFPTYWEYLKLVPKLESEVDWKRVWDVLSFVANAFGLAIQFVYEKTPGALFIQHETDTLFERTESRYILCSTREWTIPELDAFLESYSFDALKKKYYEEFAIST